jgi:hypothetical protein
MLLNHELINDGHSLRLVVTPDSGGWEVREEEDAAVLRRVHRHDWHRVERDIWLFGLRAPVLTRGGSAEH